MNTITVNASNHTGGTETIKLYADNKTFGIYDGQDTFRLKSKKVEDWTFWKVVEVYNGKESETLVSGYTDERGVSTFKDEFEYVSRETSNDPRIAAAQVLFNIF